MDKRKKFIIKFKYFIERLYPYLISIGIISLIISFNLDFLSDKNFNNVLDGVINLVSIIIGFMGAMMPIILSMKNESKFVKYVFEKDTEELFKKYLKVTIKVGIINAGLTLLMYLKDSIVNIFMKYALYYAWMFSIILFLFLTMRSMSYMITLFFSKDGNGKDNEGAKQDNKNIYSDEEVEKTKNFFK
ncbi:TPA: hypothetical protein PTV74_003944 [Clostridium botulinum]|uniref:hypothetical protein n=1 Tax=Clostridium botulinum TaxID=1491 RepID=UPI000D0E004F|nr:hypothetical protein [Clostridium botulinum]PSL96325.1 hypothetical protein C6C12_19190 [Clostridium botulinum]HDK7140064.1 hypothetical protein [Clostridium botulinum]HDK7143652.1 hypothetical protein [Clostridium botulinum]HDK7147298.1 hypothetical protein [Clostridium botulinum]HDK7151040.1 hypothetical protein [Clostridium botulinum]